MAFEIDYSFTPGETVFAVNRGTFAIHKGKVFHVQIKTFDTGDGIATTIAYALTIDNNSGMVAIEDDVFGSYEDAVSSLFATPTPTATRPVTPTPTPTRTGTPSASHTPTPSPTMTQTVTPTVTPSVTPSRM